MYFELESNRVLMFILGGGLFTIVCWATYQYYNVSGNDIDLTSNRWPYQGWESFSENDDWVQIERVV